MPRKLRKQYPGAKYHITARGVGGKSIFARDADRERFICQREYALDADSVIAVLVGRVRRLGSGISPRANVDTTYSRDVRNAPEPADTAVGVVGNEE